MRRARGFYGDLPPNPTLDAERQAGRHWVPFLLVFGMTRPGIEPLTSQSQSGRSNHKATELECTNATKNETKIAKKTKK